MHASRCLRIASSVSGCARRRRLRKFRLSGPSNTLPAAHGIVLPRIASLCAVSLSKHSAVDCSHHEQCHKVCVGCRFACGRLRVQQSSIANVASGKARDDQTDDAYE